jgi:hypothetical protein
VAKLNRSQFKFRRHESIGAEGAEQDGEYLEDCYYDIGDLGVLKDAASTQCLIVGRTGSGKSALLQKLADEETHVVSLDPDDLSLQYLSNLPLLRHLEGLGVNLMLFYKLLWRHIFAVELIKAKCGMKTENETRSFIERLWPFGKDKKKVAAIEYLEKWGRSFWQDTEYRVKEVTQKLESEVKSSVGIKLASVLEGSASVGDKTSVEEKADIIQHAQEVVDNIQMKELAAVVEMLATDLFDSSLPRFYVTVDKLDESWVDDAIRYRLIRALVETIKEYNNKIKSVKIIVAIRRDLLDRVIENTRDSGFQEEKYNPLYLRLRWNQHQLLEMLNRRVNKLVKRQYTSAPVGWADLLPAKVQNERVADYMVQRTMYRPRDMIVFFNACIDQAADKPEITAKMIVNAEVDYSQRRLDSLRDEWGAAYPELLDCAELLKKRPPRFPAKAIALEAVNEKALALATAHRAEKGELTASAVNVVDEKIPGAEFRNRLIGVFYRIGLVGLKLETYTSDSWSFLHSPAVSDAQINDDSTVAIYPMFYRALGTNLAKGNAS